MDPVILIVATLTPLTRFGYILLERFDKASTFSAELAQLFPQQKH